MINYIHEMAFETSKFYLYDTWIALERNVHPPMQNVFSWKLRVQK